MGVLKMVSDYAIAAIFLTILLAGYWGRVEVFDAFTEGAKEGMGTVVRIFPPLLGLMVAIAVFRASGALDLLLQVAAPLVGFLGIPPEAFPLAILRPISGSGSLALVSDIIRVNGPDSFVGRVASTMMGSTETIFYTLAVYFGAVGVKNIRYALGAALLADAVSVLASVWICRIFFGG